MKPKTILLVEDNGDDAELVRLMLRRSRLLNPIEVTASVHDAICYLKGEGIYEDRERYPFPILVMVDLHLPDGSGYDILRWLTRNPSRSPLAAVVLTGSDVNAIRQSYELGARSFLVKPLRFDDLRNMVELTRGLKLSSTAEGHVLEAE